MDLANIYTFDGTTMALLPGNGALAQVSIGTDGTHLRCLWHACLWKQRLPLHGFRMVCNGANSLQSDICGRCHAYRGSLQRNARTTIKASVQGWVAFAKPNGSDVTDIEVAADGTIYALSSEWPNNVYRTTWGAVTGTGCPPLTTGTSGPAITGPETVCAGAEVTYTAAADANATFYTWTLSNGFTGTSTTNSITLTVPKRGWSATWPLVLRQATIATRVQRPVGLLSWSQSQHHSPSMRQH
jgi:hypothetical protein